MPFIIGPPPAIIQPGEPWEARLGLELARRGVPLAARIDIVQEVKRVQALALPRHLLKPTLEDLRRFGGLPLLGFIPGMTGAMAAAAAEAEPLSPFSLTYVTRGHTIISSTNTVTLSGYSIGADVAGPDKRYTVMACGSDSLNFSSATIAGSAASVIHSTGILALIYLDTTGLGTTATITVNYTATGDSGVGIAIFRLVNPPSITPAAQAFSATPVSRVLTLSLNVSGADRTLAAVQQKNGGTNSWSGLTGLFDDDIRTSDRFSAALGGSAGTPLAVTDTASSTPGSMGGCAATW